MKNITNILRVVTVAALMATLYMLYKDNNSLRKEVKIQGDKIDSLKRTLYEIQFQPQEH